MAVKASEMAALAGMHKYQSREEAASRVLALVRGGRVKEKEVRAVQSLPPMTDEHALSVAATLGLKPPESVEACKHAREAQVRRLKEGEVELERLSKMQRLDDGRVQVAIASLARAETDGDAAAAAELAASLKRARALEAASKETLAVAEVMVATLAKSVGDAIMTERRTIADVVGAVKVDVVREVERQAMAVATKKEVAMRVPAELSQCATAQARMAVGTVEEADVLALAKVHNPELAHAEAKGGLVRTTIGTVAGHSIVLMGKCDAQSCDDAGHPDGGYVVEIKRRQNRLFKCIPTYERVQLECYMRLNGHHRGCLVECHDGSLLTHWVDRDDTLWDAVTTEVLKTLGGMFQEETMSTPAKK